MVIKNTIEKIIMLIINFINYTINLSFKWYNRHKIYNMHTKNIHVVVLWMHVQYKAIYIEGVESLYLRVEKRRDQIMKLLNVDVDSTG